MFFVGRFILREPTTLGELRRHPLRHPGALPVEPAQRMRTVLRKMVRWAGVLLLAAPLPTRSAAPGRAPLRGTGHRRSVRCWGARRESSPSVRCCAGDRRVVAIPEGEQAYSGVVAFVATYRTQPVAEFEVCAARPLCHEHPSGPGQQPRLTFALPTAARGGEITVSLRSVSDGSLAWWAQEGQPLLKPVARHGWPLAMARAAESFRMQAGDFWSELLVGGASRPHSGSWGS